MAPRKAEKAKADKAEKAAKAVKTNVGKKAGRLPSNNRNLLLQKCILNPNISLDRKYTRIIIFDIDWMYLFGLFFLLIQFLLAGDARDHDR